MSFQTERSLSLSGQPRYTVHLTLPPTEDQIWACLEAQAAWPDMEPRFLYVPEFHGNLEILEDFPNGLTVEGKYYGDLFLGHHVGGRLSVYGEIHGDLILAGVLDATDESPNSIRADVNIHATVHGAVVFDLPVTGDVHIYGSTGGLFIDEPIGGDLTVGGRVNGPVRIGRVRTSGRERPGPVHGRCTIRSGSERFELMSRCRNGLLLGGRYSGTVSLTPGAVTNLVSVQGAHFEDRVYVGPLVSILGCNFSGTVGIDNFDLVGNELFYDRANDVYREMLIPPRADDRDDIAEVRWTEFAATNRQLRMSLERRSNRPAARGFYLGEMDARRQVARQSGARGEWAILGLYNAISRYGTSFKKPLLLLLCLSVINTAILWVTGSTVDGASLGLADSLLVSWRSATSFFSPPSVRGPFVVGAIQILYRVVCVILATQAALAIRDRVAR